jgi:hypothetical protein
MSLSIIIYLIIGGLSFLGLVLIVLSKIMVKRMRRREKDRPIIESHKKKLRPPTWKFQKFHPSKCPHHNGIYREVFVGSQKKSIFVCADCVDAIELDEVKQRDKFKA